jgi:cytochrome c
VPGFDYSPALKNARITWNDKTLERFLAKPLEAVPGTTMTYDGVVDAQDRRDLIAYLKLAGKSAECAK